MTCLSTGASAGLSVAGVLTFTVNALAALVVIVPLAVPLVRR